MKATLANQRVRITRCATYALGGKPMTAPPELQALLDA
jgi:hypothetical protein